MNQHSQAAHEHTELIRRLENQGYLFAQPPKLITQSLLSEPGRAYDKLFWRAQKIDSDSQIMESLNEAKASIKVSITALYGLYFLMALVGVTGLLAATTVNFFYLIMVLLGWHSISLLWWGVSILGKRSSLLTLSMIDKLIFKNPIFGSSLDGNKTLKLTTFSLLHDIQKPIAAWYAAGIFHGAWLFGLLGSAVGLLLMFLFKSYHFHWESTLLNDAHFYQILGIIGYLPAKLGMSLPDGQGSSPAQFAWLTVACLMLYGFLPRSMAYIISRAKARINFSIDTQDPYFAKLLSYYNQSIVDQDDYQQPKPKPIHPSAINHRLIIAALEKPNQTPITLPHLEDFGCVDDRDDINRLLERADQLSAQICLIIDVRTAPDRGILRKIERIGAEPHGVVAKFSNAHSDHLEAWQAALGERNIAILDAPQDHLNECLK